MTKTAIQFGYVTHDLLFHEYNQHIGLYNLKL